MYNSDQYISIYNLDQYLAPCTSSIELDIALPIGMLFYAVITSHAVSKQLNIILCFVLYMLFSFAMSRDMNSKIFYIKHILLHNNLLKEILLQQFYEKQPSKWIKQIKTYMQDLDINLHAIEHYNPAKFKKLVKSWGDSLDETYAR